MCRGGKQCSNRKYDMAPLTHDTGVDDGVLRRDGEAEMQTVCVDSHTHNRGMLEICKPQLSVRSLWNMGMMVSVW